jgi:phytoene synthase
MANIAYLVHRHHADPAWVDAFLKSMRWDLQKHEYRALKDTLDYVYGAGEVIGLFMIRILRLPEEALKPARMQARAFLYLDLVRDIPVANAEGRCYFPINEYKKYGLKNLSEEEARAKPKMFTDFMHAELLRFATWQAEANSGFMYVPKRLRIGLHALVDSYTAMAQHLKNDPLTIYDQHIRPKKRTVLQRVVRRSVQRKS